MSVKFWIWFSNEWRVSTNKTSILTPKVVLSCPKERKLVDFLFDKSVLFQSKKITRINMIFYRYFSHQSVDCFLWNVYRLEYSYYIESLGNLSTECHSGALLATFLMFQNFEKIERIYFDARNKQLIILIAVPEASPVLTQGSVVVCHCPHGCRYQCGIN